MFRLEKLYFVDVYMKNHLHMMLHNEVQIESLVWPSQIFWHCWIYAQKAKNTWMSRKRMSFVINICLDLHHSLDMLNNSTCYVLRPYFMGVLKTTRKHDLDTKHDHISLQRRKAYNYPKLGQNQNPKLGVGTSRDNSHTI